MKSPLKIILFLFLFLHISFYAQQKLLSIEEVSKSLSKENIAHNLQFLASDIFEGRGTGQTGGNLAAKYLALEFDKLGLKSIGDNSTYYQYIPMHAVTALKSSELYIYYNNDKTKLQFGEDYLLYTSGEQTYVPLPGELVFAGYGINAPEFDYNDYLDIDVKGKIVVYFDGEPPSTNPEFFNGDIPTVYSYPESKKRIAISRGAVGSILIPDNIFSSNEEWEELKKEYEFEDVTLAYAITGHLSLIINPGKASDLFADSDISYDEIAEMLNTGKTKSFPLKTQLSFKGEFKRRDFLSPNIIGMIEGSEPQLKDSYVIVSAHYDHLGIGPSVKGDSIYNGALDNAIGVSTLLEIARGFSLFRTPPKRSIIFLALTGEEKGLLGSTYYTDHPIVPLHKTIANVNIDGIALFKDFSSVVGIGGEYSSLDTILINSAKRFNINVVDIPPQFRKFEAFNKSDQIAFAQAGIPSILILEGPGNKNIPDETVIQKMIEYMTNYYHTPSDDLNQQIDYEAALQHAKLIFNFCYDICNSETEPEWKENSPYINARLRSKAEKK